MPAAQRELLHLTYTGLLLRCAGDGAWAKTSGGPRRTLKLTDAGLAALRSSRISIAGGPFSNSSMIESFHRACEAAGYPKTLVYDLRHSYGFSNG
jgi:hypothetical protein